MQWLGTPSGASTPVARLHGGEIAIHPPTAASRALVARTRALVREALGLESAPWEEVQRSPEPYGRLGSVRTALSDGMKPYMADVARSVGFAETDLGDAPRLRSITAGAERDPAASAVYLLHRDTWYGCPPELLVAWVPLQDTPREHMFAFYPRWFDRPVPNTSAEHDQTQWMQEVGWHGDAPLSAYAAPTESRPSPDDVLIPEVAQGSIVLFSAAQLHQTRPVPGGPWTRYSVDFRLFPVGARTAAPSVDNHSRGAEARIDQEFSPLGGMGVVSATSASAS